MAKGFFAHRGGGLAADGLGVAGGSYDGKALESNGAGDVLEAKEGEDGGHGRVRGLGKT